MMRSILMRSSSRWWDQYFLLDFLYIKQNSESLHKFYIIWKRILRVFYGHYSQTQFKRNAFEFPLTSKHLFSNIWKKWLNFTIIEFLKNNYFYWICFFLKWNLILSFYAFKPMHYSEEVFVFLLILKGFSRFATKNIWIISNRNTIDDYLSIKI